jgi:DNA/RNA-binding domain of Phe-tRNA-synthetase-like protein
MKKWKKKETMNEIVFFPTNTNIIEALPIGSFKITDFKIIDKNYDLNSRISEIKGNLTANYNINNIKDNPIVQKYRKFYWNKLNIDPTKVRPASEALIRRVLKKKKIPIISPLVDSYNWASIESLIPMGAYDCSEIIFPILIDFTQGNEDFVPIGKDPIKLKPDILVSKDSNSIILCQYPYRDSKLSMVTNSTSEIMILAYGVPGITKQQLFRALELTKKNLVWLKNQNFIDFKCHDPKYSISKFA